MKKIIIAVLTLAASTAFAQVDSTSTMATDSAKALPADTTSQSTMSSDSTAAGSSSDSTAVSPSGSDSSGTMGSDTTAAGSTGSGNTTGDAGEITDEDLKKYAVVMDSVEGMKQALKAEISTKIKSNGKMKIARYNQLSKAVDDEAKLKELKATKEEIAFIQEVSDMKKQGAEQISQNVEKLANDYVGTAKYNKIKDSLPTDTSLRTRYDQISGDLQGQGSASAKTSN